MEIVRNRTDRVSAILLVRSFVRHDRNRTLEEVRNSIVRKCLLLVVAEKQSKTMPFHRERAAT